MSIRYDGSHTITFWEIYDLFNESDYAEPINSWDDLFLIPLARPDVVVPEPKLHILQIPGTNKRIDVTNRLPGNLTFGERKGQWQFVINHEQYGSWAESYRHLKACLHGKKMMMCLNDDPNKIYYGEVLISGYSPEANYTMITVQYDLDKGFYDLSDPVNPIPPSSRFPANPPIFISIRFIGRTKNIIETQYKLHGDSVTPPTPPDESGYEFKGWSPDIQPVTGNQDYYAIYDSVPEPSPDPGPGPGPTPTTQAKYRFIFEDTATSQVRVIASGRVKKGTKPTEPTHAQLIESGWNIVGDKIFLRWEPSVAPITKDTDFKAVYTNVPDYIKITTPPTKLSYVDQQTIDYTGMVVKAYYSNGNLFETEHYVGGVIPLSELTLEQKADISKATDGEGMYNDDGVIAETFKFESLSRNWIISDRALGEGTHRDHGTGPAFIAFDSFNSANKVTGYATVYDGNLYICVPNRYSPGYSWYIFTDTYHGLSYVGDGGATYRSKFTKASNIENAENYISSVSTVDPNNKSFKPESISAVQNITVKWIMTITPEGTPITKELSDNFDIAVIAQS